ncbi:hypothetical protein Ahy_B02g059375 isoform C [Arachis hypogaea]|uniref:Uncharacterized protein n=1 Tax=Arachis hypogaea TaxID=3818 RepID=A0A445AGL8_ARAHY|nr:hypothetical protein Ahy_B02g059375 isoform C [Arachis hypogaea]
MQQEKRALLLFPPDFRREHARKKPILNNAYKQKSVGLVTFTVAHQDTNPPHSPRSLRRCPSRSSRRRHSHFSPSLSSPTRLSDLRSLVSAHLVVPPSSVVVSLVTGLNLDLQTSNDDEDVESDQE